MTSADVSSLGLEECSSCKGCNCWKNWICLQGVPLLETQSEPQGAVMLRVTHLEDGDQDAKI